jgi:hypothetical protein
MTKQAQLVQTMCDYAVVDVSDNTTTVYTGPCMLYGIYVNTILSAHVCPVTDGATTVVTLVASAAAGTSILYPGIRFETSLIVNPHDSATGSIVVAYRKVNPDFVDGMTVITPAS